ncbi:hypothetical protein VTJ04DRAFT_7573 [Mycothermus thermophilus]|uniref:uncharacterized protein n=1 Tax=Humicola insolens TaxID=85995 RepID=UPI003744784C
MQQQHGRQTSLPPSPKPSALFPLSHTFHPWISLTKLRSDESRAHDGLNKSTILLDTAIGQSHLNPPRLVSFLLSLSFAIARPNPGASLISITIPHTTTSSDHHYHARCPCPASPAVCREREQRERKKIGRRKPQDPMTIASLPPSREGPGKQRCLPDEACQRVEKNKTCKNHAKQAENNNNNRDSSIAINVPVMKERSENKEPAPPRP